MLPEADKKNVRKGGRQAMIKLSKKIGKHFDEDLQGGTEDAQQLERDMARAALKKRAIELGLEVEHLSFRDVEKKNLRKISTLMPTDSLNTRRRSSDARMMENIKPRHSSKSRRRTRSRTPPPPKSRFTLYVKLPESEAYVSLSLRRKTVKNLLETITAKCENFKPCTVVSLYQKNKNGLKFLLDDDLMEHVENHQIFDIALEERLDEPEKYDMTLIQIQA